MKDFSGSASASKLKRHMLVHSGEKPFVCTQCSYSCTTAGSLKRHMLKHSGEKPFSCKQCNFSCTRTGALKTHMLTHSGEKPFGCTQCNYSSTQTGNLKTHLLSHSRWRRQILNGKVTSQFPFEICAGSFLPTFCIVLLNFDGEGTIKNIARGTTDPGYWFYNLSYISS